MRVVVFIRAWRIEHPADRLGPFTWRADAYPAKAWHDGQHRPYTMPTPKWKSMRYRGPEWYTYGSDDVAHAFISLRMLAYWCDEESLRVAHELDYVLRLFAAEWDGHSAYTDQLVYRPSRARLLREHSLLEVPMLVELEAHRKMVAGTSRKQRKPSPKYGLPVMAELPFRNTFTPITWNGETYAPL